MDGWEFEPLSQKVRNLWMGELIEVRAGRQDIRLSISQIEKFRNKSRIPGVWIGVCVNIAYRSFSEWFCRKPDQIFMRNKG